ncbi:hypothetical protein [Actinoplanes sp. NPDC048796]|uniref:hypothetical protein n=1 Tax=Actinoplanes sp. NPDC048796 TaxID=3155640 RepID=UPI0033D483AC
MEPVNVLAIGINLDLVLAKDGGRVNPLLGGYATEDRFTYRPNWGLPDWPGGRQTAGPVLGFSRPQIRPGDSVRAIVVALFLEHTPDWQDVGPDDVLRMYEGSRICGHGRVAWVKPAIWPMPEDEQDRLAAWLIPT